MNIPLGLIDKLIGAQFSPQPRFLAQVSEVSFNEIEPMGLALYLKFAWAVSRLPNGTYADCSNYQGQYIRVVSATELRATDDGKSFIFDKIENILYETTDFVFYGPNHPGFVGDGTNPSVV